MPRYKQFEDYFEDESGSERRHFASLEIPSQDWTTDIMVDLQPNDFVQLKKVEGVWKLATSLPDVVTAQKKQKRQNQR